MKSYQAEKYAISVKEKLATTIARSVVIIEVNNSKQSLPPCYPSNVSVHYQPKALPVLEHVCRICEKTARILIISMFILFSLGLTL